MSAEDTRNFYRNQGMVIERERIIELMQERYNSILDYLGLIPGLEQLDILYELLNLIEGETE